MSKLDGFTPNCGEVVDNCGYLAVNCGYPAERIGEVLATSFKTTALSTTVYGGGFINEGFEVEVAL